MLKGTSNKVAAAPTHKRKEGVKSENGAFLNEAKKYNPTFHARSATQDIDTAIEKHAAVTRLNLPHHSFSQDDKAPPTTRRAQHVEPEEKEQPKGLFSCLMG